MTEALGIMDEGYFVSRKDILRWINHTLTLELTQIEQLGSGSVYCQLMDAFCPGSAPLQKINWRAKQEYEFINNFKVLQSIFDRLGISKKIDIQRLAKCKYQDNLEFIQWLKRYIQLQGGALPDYDGVGKRGGNQLDLSFSQKKISALTLNKENLRRVSSNSSLNLSVDLRKSDFGEQLKTPSSRKSISSMLGRTTTQKFKKPDSTDDKKITQIKQILKQSQVGDSEQQLQRIRKLLSVKEEQEENDYI